MSKSLIKNFSIYTFGNILPRISMVLLLPLYTRYMSPEDYGITNSLQVIVSLGIVFFTLALDRSIFRLFFDYKSEKEIKIFLGTLVTTIFIFSSVLLILVFTYSELVNKIFASIRFYPFYAYALLGMYFQIFSLVPKAYLRVIEKAKSFLIISLAEFFISTFFILIFVVFLEEGAEGYLKGSLVGAVLLLPYYLYLTKKISTLKIDFKVLKAALLFSIPAIPNIIGAWIMDLSDRIFIERYFSLADVGIYSIGYKLGGLLIIFSQAFYKAYNPVFFRIATSMNIEESKKKLYDYNKIYLLVIMISGFFVAFFTQELILLLFDQRYLEARFIAPIITLAYVIGQSTGLLNMSLYQEKKSAIVMWIFLLSSGFNVLLNFMLVPIFGMYGAALATLLTYLFLLVFEYQIVKKYYFIPFDWSISIILIIMISLFMIMEYINIENILLSLLCKTIIFTVVIMYLYKKNSELIKSLIKSSL